MRKAKISIEDCLLGLGEQGTGLLAGGYGAVVGQALIPIPVIGGVIGGMVGSVMAGAVYRPLVDTIHQAHLAEEEYRVYRAYADEAMAQMRAQKQAFEEATTALFHERALAVRQGFAIIDEASRSGDFDQIGAGLQTIAQAFGKDIGISTFDGFDRMMQDDSVDFIL